MKQLLFILIILLSVPVLAKSIQVPEAQYNQILNRLEADKKIISDNNTRWFNLKKSSPKIEYNIEKEDVVIQTIEIPVYQADSLKYQVKFKIKLNQEKPSFFPLKFFLGATFEYNPPTSTIGLNNLDIKLGFHFFSTAPLKENLNLGLNLLVGIRSCGASISYTFPKYIKNTSLHIYVGMNYTTVKPSYGIGISIFF